MTDPELDPIVVADQDGSAHIDLYALDHGSIEEPPRSLLKALAQIGPGLILAASIVGTGELIATTSTGAQQGFVLLWLILISCVIKVFIQVEMGRYAITRGKTSLGAIHTLPGPRLGTSWLCWLWLFMMLATNGQLAAMEGLVGEVAVMAFGVGTVTQWAAVTCVAAIALLLSGGYKRLERITTILVGLVTLITVVGALRLPMNLSQVASGLTFQLPNSRDGLFLAFTTFGITGVGASELFAYPYWCIEKGYARAAGPRSDDPAWAARARGWLRVMQIDAWFSMVVFTMATVAFYFMGAAVLNGQLKTGEITDADLKGANMIRTLTQMYVQVLGGWARPFFLIGAWIVLFKTLYVATAANSRLTADFLHLGRFYPQTKPAARERTVKILCVIYPIFSFVLFYWLKDPRLLIIIGGAAQAMMLPLIAGATLYLRYRDADPRVAPGWVSDVFSWLALATTGVVAVYSLVMMFAK